MLIDTESVSAPIKHLLATDDATWLAKMAWTAPSLTSTDINRAARDYLRMFAEDWVPVTEWDAPRWSRYRKNVAAIDHWRACHAYPLNTMQINLRRMARKYDRSPIVAQRTKRLVSIGTKLDRNPSMKLTQMQDVGGCRAILKSVEAVKLLDRFIRSESRMFHELATVDDYIACPKDSGYRGIHLVYRFRALNKPAADFNGLKIEIQLRSQYQHAWATTVETVGTFLGQALKASSGPDEWLRFFQLMGSAIALREKQAPVPGTADEPKKLIAELDDLAWKLNVEHRLRGYANAIQTMATQVTNAHYFLMELDPNSSPPLLNVTGFARERAVEAQKAYADAEIKVKSNPGTDAVLVSVESITKLSQAYPNYYADTRIFLDLLDQALKGTQQRIRV